VRPSTTVGFAPKFAASRHFKQPFIPVCLPALFRSTSRLCSGPPPGLRRSTLPARLPPRLLGSWDRPIEISPAPGRTAPHDVTGPERSPGSNRLQSGPTMPLAAASADAEPAVGVAARSGTSPGRIPPGVAARVGPRHPRARPGLATPFSGHRGSRTPVDRGQHRYGLAAEYPASLSGQTWPLRPLVSTGRRRPSRPPPRGSRLP
jgi:hypothetical protein